MALVGGFALVAASIFFLSLAFSRGWITEPMRVLIGLVAGSVAIGVGVLSFNRRTPLLGNVLTAVGLGIVSIALFAATRGYGLIPPEAGLAGALAAAVAAAVIAIRYDAREVAVFGLVAALIAPPVMGASPNTLTLLFVAVTLVGTTAIALFRSWRWLPSIAFVLAAPQLASWLAGGADAAQAMVALSAFWVLNIVAAGGEEVRIRRDDLRPSSATLVLANAAFLTWGGYVVLTGSLHAWLGTFIALASLAHLVVGGAFLRRQGLEHLFGNLVAGTGVALLALAAFVQLGAALVPVAWAAEGAALAWLAVRRRHMWSALASLCLGGLAMLHLVTVEYPLAQISSATLFAPAWLHPEAASLVAVLAAMAVAGWFARIAWIRSTLVAVGATLLGYAAVFEVVGPALATTWVAIAVAALLLDWAIRRDGTREDLSDLGALSRPWPAIAAAAAFELLAVGHVVLIEYPISHAGLRSEPYYAAWVHPELVPVAALIAAGLVMSVVWPARSARSVAAALGTLLLGYVLTFEVVGPLLIGLLVALALIATEMDSVIARFGTRPGLQALDRWSPNPWHATIAAAVVGVVAIADIVVIEYPASSSLNAVVPEVPYGDAAALSLAILLVGLALAGARLGTRGIRSGLAAIGILLVAWSVPFEFSGSERIALLAVLLPTAVIGDRAIARLRDAPRFTFLRLPPVTGGLASGAGAVAWLAGLAYAIATQLRPTDWGRVTPPAIPFTDETALVALILAGAAIGAAAWAVTVTARQLALLASLVPLAVAVPLEVYADFVVVLWLLLAAAALVITRPGDRLRLASRVLAALLGGGAVIVAFTIVAPLDRLWVVDPALESRPPLLPGWWIALAAVAMVTYLASRRTARARRRASLEVLAAALGVYLVSVGVVDVFQRMAGGSIPVEELAKQAQVALSVAWTALGVLLLGFSFRTRRTMPGHIGLGLIALATAKVFVVDLAAMDVAYRALVLAGLGVLLLVSAWLFTHRGPRAGARGPRGPMPVG